MAIEFTVDHDHTVFDGADEEQLVGVIAFTVQTRPGDFQVRHQGGPTTRTITLPRRTAYLAIDGHLYKDATSRQPFRLVANDPAFNLDHITYRADFELTTQIGEPVPVRHCYFPAPSTDTTLYLTKVIDDPDQIVMEVRTKGYAEDILDAGGAGIDVVQSATAADARAAIGAASRAELLDAARRPNVAVVIGDSISYTEPMGGNGYRPRLVDNWFNHLCIETEQRIKNGGIYATPGATLAGTIANTHLPQVLALNPRPGFCFIFGGTNDVTSWSGSGSFAQSKTTLKEMIAALTAVNIKPILVTLPPRSALYNPGTIQWNTWLRRYAALSGLPLLDTNRALTSSAGVFRSFHSLGDSVHPSTIGHKAISAQAIDDRLWEHFQPQVMRGSPGSGDLSNLFGSGTAAYGMFLVDTNSDGVADGLTSSGTATFDLDPVDAWDETKGQWQQIIRTTGQAGNATLTSAPLTGWTVGDTLAFSCRVDTVGFNGTAEGAPYYVALRCDGAAENTEIAGINGWTTNTDGLQYVEFAIPPGTTELTFFMEVQAVVGTADPILRVAEVTIHNLTTGGALT